MPGEGEAIMTREAIIEKYTKEYTQQSMSGRTYIEYGAMEDAEIAAIIAGAVDWSDDITQAARREMCDRAGMLDEYDADEDGTEFEDVLERAADKLGVNI